MAIIQQYNDKVTKFHGDKKIGKTIYPIHYGIELEYEVKTPTGISDKSLKDLVREKAGEKIYNSIKDFAFAKHDGSLNNGFEVVTTPISLGEHHKIWDNFFNIAAKSGLEVKSTCGMHVHASRELLSNFQIGKMMVFIFSPQNNDFICKIGGRKPPKKYAEIGMKKIGDVKRHNVRYSALNLTNYETVEFRFFKGTLHKQHVLKNVEFCDALIRFCWPSKVGYLDLKHNGVKLFCEYITKNKNEYPNLYDFLIKKGFINVVKRKKKTQKNLKNRLMEKYKVSSKIKK